MTKKKVTKHVVGDVYFFLDEFLSQHKKENFKITGLEFSNLGAQGRRPLFDVSHSQKGTIMAYWKDICKNHIVISAPEPGYEIKAPKSLRCFFHGGASRNFKITHLDVTHLDVSNTTDFGSCFEEFGAQKGSEIIGLEAWNVSSGKIFDFMFGQAFPFNESINLNLSSWRFSEKEEISFYYMFHCFGKQASKVILDVSDWNTTNVCLFSEIFQSFAPHEKIVELKGVEDWRLGTNLVSLDHAFDDFAKASSCRLDLSGWSAGCTQKPSMEDFSKGVFFRIKEPTWENY